MTVDEIAEKIRGSSEWDLSLCSEFCKLAGMESEWNDADGETFESVLDSAAHALGVNIY